MEPSEMLHHEWDNAYVALSYVIAVIASYMSLELAGRVGQNTRTAANRFWLVAQALVLGYGIWAMHFIGMMAFKVNAAASINYPLTVSSGVIVVLLVYLALLYVRAAPLTAVRLAVSSALTGTGIVVMHYLGMYAYQLPGTETKLAWLPLIGSVLVAMAASTVSLLLFHRLSGDWAARQKGVVLHSLKLAAAGVMGLAVLGVHYLGMAALQYHVVDELKVGIASAGIDTSLLALVVGVVSFLMMGLALTSMLMDAGRGGDLDELDFGSAAD
ncbi:hypothetical protein LAJ19_10600 [Deinococcus taeanensis]|uniref:MHYT domain-containing protein n=1 Tax=Deinococcus taeanensis TaxID=2737050 RepID=UPI001CDCB3AF|nr:MHYT domain-containing protein [Deinococcus taeanensis]UBV42082.1 hypothetical protein LAJ19_10600 [Deinococcus taeanensis]